MKFKDVAKLSAEDQEKKIKEAKIELLKLNGQVATGTIPKSPGKIKSLRRTIAKIHTKRNQEQVQK